MLDADEFKVRARHILVLVPPGSDGKAERQKIEALKKRIESGEKLEDVANAESDDAASKARGGDLGGRVIGDRCEIGPHTRLVDCAVGPGACVEQTVAHGSEIGEGARVGPFAHLPPGSTVGAGAETGAFYTAPVEGVTGEH